MKKIKFLSLLFIGIFVFSFWAFAEEIRVFEPTEEEMYNFTENVARHNMSFSYRNTNKAIALGNERGLIFSDSKPEYLSSDKAKLLSEYLIEFKEFSAPISENDADFQIAPNYPYNYYTSYTFKQSFNVAFDKLFYLRLASEDLNEYLYITAADNLGIIWLQLNQGTEEAPEYISRKYKFKIEDTEAFMKWIDKIFENVYSYEEKSESINAWYVKNMDFENHTYTLMSNNKEKRTVEFKDVETLKFELKPDESYYDTLFEEIKGNGERIYCTIDHYNDGANSIYIWKLKGEGGEKTLFAETCNSSISGFGGGNNRNIITFSESDVFVDNAGINLYNAKYHDVIFLRGKSEDGKNITNIEIINYIHPGSYSEMNIDEYLSDDYIGYKSPNKMFGENIEYEIYYKIKKVYQGLNFGVRFGIPDNALTTSEFKADGNITEDQYYDPIKRAQEKAERDEANEKAEKEAKKEAEAEKEAEDKEKAEKESAESEKKEKVVSEKEAAEALEKLGLMKGTQNGLELEKSFSRAEAATMLVRLLGKEEEVNSLKQADTNFADMENHWAKDYVSYCYHNEITKGTSETTFSPEKSVTAEEYLTLVLRLMGYGDAEPENAKEMTSKYIVTDSEKLEEITAGSFNREKMAYISYMALVSQMSDGERLIDNLIDDGAVETEIAESIGLK